MQLSEYLSFFTFLYSFLPFSLVDALVIALLILYLLSESIFSLLESVINTIKLLISFVVSLFAYPFLTGEFLEYLKIWQGVYNAISFVCIFLACFIILSGLTKFLISSDVESHNNDRYAKLVSGFISFFIILTVISSIIVSLGTSSTLNKFLHKSLIINKLFIWEYKIETNTRELFYHDSPNGMNVIGLTNNNPVNFHTSFKQIKAKNEANEYIRHKINKLRLSNNHSSLAFNDQLYVVADNQARSLANRSVLSVKDSNSLLIYDRLFEHGIPYSNAEEIVVFAGTEELLYESLVNYSMYRNRLMDNFQSSAVVVYNVDGKGLIGVVELLR